eukprot:3675737-Pyramimonas_sp.AAC.1
MGTRLLYTTAIRGTLTVYSFLSVDWSPLRVYTLSSQCGVSSGRKWGNRWEKAGNWTQGEKRGRGVSGVLRAPLPLLAQEDPERGAAARHSKVQPIGALRGVVPLPHPDPQTD